MIVTYPWMPKELNPNSRVHWATLAKKKKLYKELCFVLTKEAKLPKVIGDRAHLEITFFKPNKIRRDLDNCLASFKAGLDGISQALGLDDSRFLLAIEIADDIGGYVKVNFNYKGQ
jgi:crossover junction endodeoxyribonuclease RusA